MDLRKTIKDILLFAFCYASASMAGAQTVIGLKTDTIWNNEIYIYYNPQRGGAFYDGLSEKVKISNDGHFKVDADKMGDMNLCPAYLVISNFPEVGMLLDKKHPTRISIKNNGGTPIVSFDGPNAAASECMKLYHESYDYKLFNKNKEEGQTLSNKQLLEELDKRYAVINKKIKKVKDLEARTFLTTLNEDAYINFSLRLLSKDDPKFAKTESKIDVNSWMSLYNYLPHRYIETKIPKNIHDLFGKDMTDYGLEYMKIMQNSVSDPYVKHALLDDCAEVTLNYGKGYEDIDRFWIPFCQYAGDDTQLIKKYSDKVISIKSMKKGKQAPDFAFNDANGNVHHLSDYRGKTLYIDFWATWCVPCCKEIPHLEKRVTEMKDYNDFVFISISMDTNIKAWKKKIDSEKPEWPQFIIDQENSMILSRQYGITSIPRFMVIMKDGTIGDGNAFRPSDENFVEKLKNLIK